MNSEYYNVRCFK